MEDLESIIESISEFDSWNMADRIRLFAWFVASSGATDLVTPSLVQDCFTRTASRAPTAIGPFLSAMAKLRQAQLIKVVGGYRLERSFKKSYDELYGARKSAFAVGKQLTDLATRLTVPEEIEYLRETLDCFRARAFRASILMAWNLAYWHLVSWIFDKKLNDFNAQFKISFPKVAFEIKAIDEISYINEERVLTILRSAMLVSNSLSKVLKEKLDRRNAFAHPSATLLTDATAEEYIRDIIGNVFR